MACLDEFDMLEAYSGMCGMTSGGERPVGDRMCGVLRSRSAESCVCVYVCECEYICEYVCVETCGRPDVRCAQVQVR